MADRSLLDKYLLGPSDVAGVTLLHALKPSVAGLAGVSQAFGNMLHIPGRTPEAMEHTVKDLVDKYSQPTQAGLDTIRQDVAPGFRDMNSKYGADVLKALQTTQAGQLWSALHDPVTHGLDQAAEATVALAAKAGPNAGYIGHAAANAGKIALENELVPGMGIAKDGERAIAASGNPITEAFEKYLREDPIGAEKAYAAHPETMGGKVLNTDIARELSPHYLADRTLSADVHEPASDFIKSLYQQKLAEAPKPGEQPLVSFTAGGTGSGKTKSLGDTSTPQIIYDTNMNTLGSSQDKIEQALAANKRAEIHYTYRDPVDALVNGALPRAMRQEAEHGTGRTVPIEKHLETHMGANDTMRYLAAEYLGHPDVTIRATNNSFGKGNARVLPLDQIPDLSGQHEDIRNQLHEALDNEFAQGRISEKVYRGFKGPDAPGNGTEAHDTPGVPGVRGPVSPGADGYPQQEDQGPALGDTLDFLHMSNLQGPSVTLDPKYYGRGIKGAEARRGDTKTTSLYPAGISPSDIEQGLESKTPYRVQMPRASMYDLSADPEGHLATQPDFSSVEDAIKDAGYMGYHLPTGDGIFRGQGRLFHPTPATRIGDAPVEAEEDLAAGFADGGLAPSSHPTVH